MPVGLLRVLFDRPSSLSDTDFLAWRQGAFSKIPGVYLVDILTATDKVEEAKPYRYENSYHVEDTSLINNDLIQSLLSAENGSHALGKVDFHLYERIEFNEREDIEPRQRPVGSVVITAGMSPIDTEDIIKDFYDWYQKEHMPILRDVPGWRTGSRYKRVATFGDNAEFASPYVAIHVYNPENGLGGEQWTKSIKSPWTKKVVSRLAAPSHRREWKLEV
ncbi:hypothetical protein H2198_000173 [Neophaeococcomyces mojaviensis]|uniref:Uncharacterized protein n=1 Tax=Neophaeococcomyces mojaviensis TaxID=3383035 RepID=A0ACC3AKI7_9EURO|nr:hypothetical protein H2198_000173 [Knufia sp. JES_112]